MSTLDLTATVTLGQMAEAIERHGGTITWSANRPGFGNRIKIEGAEIDAEDAYDALPSRFFNHDDDETTIAPDERDLRDFLGSCLSGDRFMASALLPRIVSDGPAQAAAEQLLYLGGRA